MASTSGGSTALMLALAATTTAGTWCGTVGLPTEGAADGRLVEAEQRLRCGLAACEGDDCSHRFRTIGCRPVGDCLARLPDGVSFAEFPYSQFELVALRAWRIVVALPHHAI
ncbi:hypothetical protein [Kitasatospora sp. NPDC004289]